MRAKQLRTLNPTIAPGSMMAPSLITAPSHTSALVIVTLSCTCTWLFRSMLIRCFFPRPQEHALQAKCKMKAVCRAGSRCSGPWSAAQHQMAETPARWPVVTLPPLNDNGAAGRQTSRWPVCNLCFDTSPPMLRCLLTAHAQLHFMRSAQHSTAARADVTICMIIGDGHRKTGC